jgi:hypothetical protein
VEKDRESDAERNIAQKTRHYGRSHDSEELLARMRRDVFRERKLAPEPHDR